MSTSEIILLSSDDEEEPPCKKTKPSTASPSNVTTINLDESENGNEINEEKENISDKCINEENVSEEPSTSKDTKLSARLERFLVVCSETCQKSEFENISKKFNIIYKLYNRCSEETKKSSEMENFIQTHLEKATKSPSLAFAAFYDVLEHLQFILKKPDFIEVESEKKLEAIKKLEKAMRILVKKIRSVECKEVNFEDDENSTYMQAARYKKRLEEICTEYTRLTNYNPWQDQFEKDKLNFDQSEYPEINSAIQKKYKKYDQPFPSYEDIETLVAKTVKEHDLALTQDQQTIESVKCFKKLGEHLQQRRKNKLYKSHVAYISYQEDPAKDNPELNNKLKENRVEAKKKIDELCDMFVLKQETKGEGDEEKDESEDEFSESDASESEPESGAEADEDIHEIN